VHEALPMSDLFGDEGAANHNRLCKSHGEQGLEVFVYGREALMRQDQNTPSKFPTKYPGRQTLEASQAIARRHVLGLPARFIAQNPAAIDSGAFHNDVVAVANENVFLFHERAFADPKAFEDTLSKDCMPLGFAPCFIMASEAEMPFDDVIRSYFFNSQLLTLPNKTMTLVLPMDAQEILSTQRFADACVAGNNPITQVQYLDVRESMRNGGGPACLRLRVVMSDVALNSVAQGVMMDDAKLDALENWVKAHYRDRLAPEDLGDLSLIHEVQTALDALCGLLGLNNIYDFQR
jgi:succinylarginine dihydrolase